MIKLPDLRSFSLSSLPTLLVLIALVGLIIYQLFQLYLSYSAENIPVTAVNTAPVVARDKGTDIRVVTSTHLFGESNKPENKASNVNIDTSLGLTLRGIFYDKDERLSLAIIQNTPEAEKYFILNDSVFSKGKLKEIHTYYVIIKRNDGRLVKLELPKKSLGIKFTSKSEHEKLEEKRAKILTDYRQKLMARDGMELIKLFGFDTAYRKGGFYGFEIKVLGEDGQKMINTLGIKEGDIVVAVNGERFAESIEAVQNLTKLKDAKSINVEIDREGVPLFFNFNFASLDQDQQGEIEADLDEPGYREKSVPE